MSKSYWLVAYLAIAITLVLYTQINHKSANTSKIHIDAQEFHPKANANELFFHSKFVSDDLTKEVHSATAAPLSDGDLLLFWYGGEREGSSDVAIYSRRLDSKSGQWGTVTKLVERLDTAKNLNRNIRKLGNPIAFEYRKNEIWLFYVSVSLGGWAGSAINLQKSFDNGLTWEKPRRLISSPFFNVSTLVKERPIRYQDGSVGLPVYHEFLGKFAELLHLDAQGEVINKYRISTKRQAIQPMLIALSDSRMVALMRNVDKQSTRRLWYSETIDSGHSWQNISALAIPNPNAAISAIALEKPHILLMAFNNHPTERNDLTLGLSLDAGKTWKNLTVFEQSTDLEEHNPFSYPFLVQTENKLFHLFYTWKRKKIKYIVFNQQQLVRWIENKQLNHAMQEAIKSEPSFISHY